MGVVIRQSFWGSTIGYVGILLGYVSALILRPKFLDESQIGLVTLVVSNAMMIAPIVNFGMPSAYLRIINYFEKGIKERNRVFTFQLIIILVVNALVVVFALLLKNQIEVLFAEKSSLYNDYIFTSVIVLVCFSCFTIFSALCRSLLDAIFPEFINNILLRIGNIVIIFLFGFQILTFDQMVWGIGIIYGIGFFAILTYSYIYHNYRPVFSFKEIPSNLTTEILKFGITTVFSSIGVAISGQIFFTLVSIYLGLSANGIFTTCFYIATVIEMPKRAMAQIIVPLITKPLKEKSFQEVDKFYKKSSITLSIIGLLLFLGLITNLNDLFALIPKGEAFSEGALVVVLISSAKVIDLIFGFNTEIISFSNFYRKLPLISLTYGLITLVTCFMLIPSLGIDGAAWSFLLSMIIFNLVKYLYIKFKIGISPFTKQHVTVLLIFGLIYLCIVNIPFGFEPVINILIRSILIITAYTIPLYLLNVSSDINNLANQIIRRAINYKK